MSRENKNLTLHCCLVFWMLTVCCYQLGVILKWFLRIKTWTSGPTIVGGTGQRYSPFPQTGIFLPYFMVHHQAGFHLKPDASTCSRKHKIQRRWAELGTSMKDSRKRAGATLPLAWLHLLPAVSSEQAPSQQEGQEIVGTRRISAGPTTSWRKLLPENNVTNSASSEGGGKQPGRKPENNEEVDVTPLPLERLWVGAPQPAGVRLCFLKLIDKNKAQFPRWPFPCCPFSCIFILLLWNHFPLELCAFAFPYLRGSSVGGILNWIPALFRPFNTQMFLFVCRLVVVGAGPWTLIKIQNTQDRMPNKSPLLNTFIGL